MQEPEVTVQSFLNQYRGKKEDKAFSMVMEDNTAVITMDCPGEKVNKWSMSVMLAFFDMMDTLEKNPPEAAVFISAKKTIFIAGADIKEIQGIHDEKKAYELSRLGQQVFDRWERLPFPTVAAIHGAAMGGGCEFALSATARICSDDPATKIGLPEVLLGILPGWGGTQRLPRMISLPKALDLMLTGRGVSGKEAKKIGLAQDCVPKELLRSKAIALAARLKKQKFSKFHPQLSVQEGFLNSMFMKPVVFSKAKSGVMEKTLGNYPAPLAIIKVIKDTAGSGKPSPRGFETESREFAKLCMTPEARNLVGLFFLSEGAKKTVYPPQKPLQGKKVEGITVVGAGVMGAGIVQVGVAKGAHAYLRDMSADAVARGMSVIATSLNKKVKRRKMTPRERDLFMARVHPVTDGTGLKKSQLVIEAVFEELKVKQDLFSGLEAVIPADTVLVTNTSSLSVKDIAAPLKRPERVVGLHFFNPVEKMPLVEVVATDFCDPQAVATALDFVKAIGKTPVVCKDSPGFVVNRLLLPYLNEAGFLGRSGPPLDQVDECLKKFGMPMGPYRLCDEVGMDILSHVSEHLHHAFGDRCRPPSEWFEKLLQKKILGRKTGVGFYKYNQKKETFNSEIYKHLGLGSPSRMMRPTCDKWIHRLLYPMINEAARLLEEKVVDTPEAIDLAMIMGAGFAPFRGGLLRWADSVGVPKIVADLEEMGSLYNATERFQPSTYLKELGRKGKGFYSA